MAFSNKELIKWHMLLLFQAIYPALCCSVWTWEKILPWPQTDEIRSFEHYNRLKRKKQNSQWLFQYLALTYSSSSLSIGLLSFWSFWRGILSLYESLKWNNFDPGRMDEHRKMSFGGLFWPLVFTRLFAIL